MTISNKKALMAALLSTAVILPNVSQAGLITETISFEDSEISGDLNFDFVNLDQLSSGDVTIDFQVRSDLGDSYSRLYRSGYYHSGNGWGHYHSGYYYNSNSDTDSGTTGSINTTYESVGVNIEGVDLGLWLDGVSNDLISGNDQGFFNYLHSGSYTMAADTFNSLIEDAILSVGFDFSDSVNHGYGNEFASVSIRYEGIEKRSEKVLTSVPEPGTLALFALGVLGLVNRKKMSIGKKQ